MTAAKGERAIYGRLFDVLYEFACGCDGHAEYCSRQEVEQALQWLNDLECLELEVVRSPRRRKAASVVKLVPPAS